MKKKEVKRPNPKMLGSGMAYKAGDALKKRRESYNAFEKELFGSNGMKGKK